MAIYDNVKALCDKQGKTLRDVEKKAGIGLKTIDKWKYGVAPRVDTLQRVADVLGVTVNRLLKED